MSYYWTTTFNPYSQYSIYPMYNWGYNQPMFMGLSNNTAIPLVQQQTQQPQINTTNIDSVSFRANKQFQQQKKDGLSTGAKWAIGIGATTALAVGADFLFCKGKHVKSLFNKGRKNTCSTGNSCNTGKPSTNSTNTATSAQKAKTQNNPTTSTVNVVRTNQAFLNRINNIPVTGMREEEKPLLEMFRTSMYDLLETSKGKAILPTEIRFVSTNKNGTLKTTTCAASASKEGVLNINRDYFNHIDENIENAIEHLTNKGVLTRNSNGQYRIADFLRNGKSDLFEKRLNEYSKDWTVIEKFNFTQADFGYYLNLQSQATNHTIVMLENIMKNPKNQNILKECNLFKSQAELCSLSKEKQYEYLQEIFSKAKARGKQLILPDDTILVRSPNHITYHELGHINHRQVVSKEQFANLKTKEKIAEWQNNPDIQAICSRISPYAKTSPVEFVAEVFAGLANGQNFHPDVMALYKKCGGAII